MLSWLRDHHVDVFMGIQTQCGHYHHPLSKTNRLKETSQQVSSAPTMASNAKGKTNTASSVPLLKPVTQPVLKSVDPVQVSLFLKDREEYEQEVSEKRKELPTITLAPYTSCTDRTLFKHMVLVG